MFVRDTSPSTNLKNLPLGIPEHISEYLNQKDRFLLSKLDKAFHRSLEFPLMARLLFQLVAEGEEDRVNRSLKNRATAAALLEEKDHCNPLLIKQYLFKDFAGREFRDTSPFQYMCWALDKHMVKMAMKNFSAKDFAIAQHQKDELLTRGTLHGSHFSFEPLFKAYTDAIKNTDRTMVMALGHEQRTLPPHIISELCRKYIIDMGHNKITEIDFKDNTLSRLYIAQVPNSIHDSQDSSYFPHIREKGLGFDGALVRVGYPNWMIMLSPHLNNCDYPKVTAEPSRQELIENQIGMENLFAVRISEFSQPLKLMHRQGFRFFSHAQKQRFKNDLANPPLRRGIIFGMSIMLLIMLILPYLGHSLSPEDLEVFPRP